MPNQIFPRRLRFYASYLVLLGFCLFVSGAVKDCPRLCKCFSKKGNIDCRREFAAKVVQTQDLPSWVNSIVFFDGPLSCDCGLKEFLTKRSTVKVFGTCSADQQIHELTREETSCDVLFRKRRAVPDEELNTTKANSEPGGVMLPCDFEQGFCQWYHSSDSDFHWERNRGQTPSANTGPDYDHTTGSGWYIYSEASYPRREAHAARLTSPTLAPIQENETCSMDFYIHMKGQHIGSLNIYQAPVDDFKTQKASWAGAQGSTWIPKRVEFDSKRVFQIIIESLRGVWYQSDIALDDIKFSSGCRRLAPSYVRVSDDDDFKSGPVEIFQEGDWKPVCKDGWTQKDSIVACKELGFVNSSSIFDQKMNQSLEGLPRLDCAGNESSVSQCANGSIGNISSCPSNKTASISCSGISAVCPLRTHLRCPEDRDGTAKCISKAQLCDFKDDCWDGFDEKDCENYTRCDFEDPQLCGWIQVQHDEMDWTRHKGSTHSSNTGPSEDHNENPDGYYLYTEVSGRNGGEKARMLVTPRFKGDHGGLCRVRFFYHMLGWSIGHLRVYAEDSYSQEEIWSKSYSQGYKWKRAEITLANLSASFQVVFESEHSGQSAHGDIAIDDVSFTPECRPALHENVTCRTGTFHCHSHDCIPVEDKCDFQAHCYDGSDELNCGLHTPGRCDFERDFCDWSNMTDDQFDWERKTGQTVSWWTGPNYDHTKGFRGGGHYIHIEASNPRQYRDKARILSPQFMWTNVQNCKLRFYYHMYGSWISMGRLLVYLKNTITSVETLIWQRSGNQGNTWFRADIPIATNWTVAQVVIEAVRGQSFSSDIAIDDVSFSPACYPSVDVHLVKNYAVRLAGFPSSIAGRVEIFRVGQWGTICDDEWDLKDAEVVCHQLGYSGAVVDPGGSHYDQGKGQIWLDDLKCLGNETDLSQCPHNGWAQHNCDHSKDAGARCSLGGSTKPVRLVDRVNSSRGGRVEIYHQGTWGAVCFDGWDLHDAFVVCRMIGYSGAKEINSHTVTGAAPHIWLKDVRCHGNEDSLGECSNSGWGVGSCSYGYAGVVCNDDGLIDGEVRLAGGSSPKEGRIEIFYRGEWGTVCEDQWSATSARVVCHELGFTTLVKSHQSFGPGIGRVWMEDVECAGNESGLALCPHAGWAVGSCLHDEDVGIVCSDDAYVGCYKDQGNHVMPRHRSMAGLTPVKCLRYCQTQGFSYAGLSWATDCYCGDHYDKYGKDTESNCDTPCAGDVTKKCGGPWTLSVYSTDPAIVPTSIPGYPPVRQSCSAVYHFWGFTVHSPVSMPDYFQGDNKNGVIWSPGHPANYPVRLQCVWVLKLLPGTQVKIEFKSFQTEAIHDYVEVRDGKRQYSRQLTPPGGFSGNETHPLTASNNIMWIKFVSDPSVTDTGFEVIYTAIGAPTTIPTPTPTVNLTIEQRVEGGCHPVYANKSTTSYDDPDHNSGYVYTPDYPSNYHNNMLCQWVIFVVEGKRIVINVEDIDIRHSSDGAGPGDVLRIDDGITHERSTGRNLPWEFTSSRHFVRLFFSSDDANTGKGFKLRYERDSGGKGKNKGDYEEHKRKGLSGGGIAGIVLSLVALFAFVIFLGFCLKKKKRRPTLGARHGFVNEAYENNLNLQESTRDSETQPQPGAYAALHAPPPYSQLSDTTQYATPFGDLALTPIGSSKTGHYANLYAAPPAYDASAQGGITSSTGLGSVTSLRDAAGNEVTPSSQREGGSTEGAIQAGLLPPLSRAVLPPIRGNRGNTDEKKVALPDDQAGPLPDKTPLTVETPSDKSYPAEPSAPPRPASAQSTLFLVSSAPSAISFDGDGDGDGDVPFEFLCPITNEIMKDPVTAADGYTYEKRAIRSWFRRHSTNQTSPMTSQSLSDTTLRQNDELRGKIEEFVRRQSQA